MFIFIFRNMCGRMAVHAANFVITITLLLWLPPLFAGVNPDGSYSEVIPIEVPAGRGSTGSPTGGIQPKLALAYNSNSPNGIVGVGWGLQGLPSITRINYGRGINYDG